jgi:hypothetical protein
MSGPRNQGISAEQRRRIKIAALFSLVELAVNICVMIRVDGDPRIILLAFLFALLARYAALWILLKAHRRYPSLANARWIRLFTRHPREGGAYVGGEPDLSIAQHLILIFFIGAFPYTIVTLPLGSGAAPDGIGWMLPILAVRLLHDLLTQSLLYVDFSKSESENANYNFHGIITLLLLFLLVSLLAPVLGLLSLLPGPARFIGTHLQWIVAAAFLLANQFMVFSRECAPEFSVKEE